MFLPMLQPGEVGEIVAVLGEGELRQRLLDIGFIPGQIVRVIRYAPLGDPIEVEIMGTRISLRREEAALIKVRPIRRRGRGRGSGGGRRRKWRLF